jgi:hypothetical protein
MGDWDADFFAAGVEDRDLFMSPGVAACSYRPLTAIVSCASSGERLSSSFMSLSAASTASGFISRLSSAIFVQFKGSGDAQAAVC